MSKFSKTPRWLIASQYADIPQVVDLNAITETYAAILAVNRDRWWTLQASFGQRSCMFGHEYLDAEMACGVEAYVPRLIKNDQHPKTVALFKLVETVDVWLKSGKMTDLGALDVFIRQIASQSLVVVPTHPEAIRGYVDVFKSIRKNLKLTEYVLRFAGFRQSIISTCNVHSQRFGDPLLFVETKQLPLRFYTTHFVTNVVTPSFVVKMDDSIDVMLGSGLVAILSSSFKESFVPGMVKSLYQTKYGVESNKNRVDGLSTLNVNCKEGYTLGRIMLLYSQQVDQSYLHGLKSWEIYDDVYDREEMIFVHPDNDYTKELVEFLLQFEKVEHIAFVIKVFGLSDLINLVAGRFYFEYASSITYAVWLVSTGKFFEMAWSYYTRVSAVLDMWPVHKLSPCMSITRNDAFRFAGRMNISIESKYHCMERMLFEVVEGYPNNRYAQLVIALIMNVMVNKYGNAILFDVNLNHAILATAKKLAAYPLSCVQEMIKRGFTMSALSADRYCLLVNNLSNSNLYGMSDEQNMAMVNMQQDLAEFDHKSVKNNPQPWAIGIQLFKSNYDEGVQVDYEVENQAQHSHTGDHHIVVPQLMGSHGEETNEDDVNGHGNTEVLSSDFDIALLQDVYSYYPDIEIHSNEELLTEVQEMEEDYVPQTIAEVVSHISDISDHIDDLDEWEWVFDFSQLSWAEQHIFLQIYVRLEQFAEKFARGRATAHYVRKLMDVINHYGLTYTFREYGIMYAVMHAYHGFEGRIYWSGPTAAVLIANVEWFTSALDRSHRQWMEISRPSRPRSYRDFDIEGVS